MSHHAIASTARPGRSRSANDQLASGLGWFSIGLGLLELIASEKLCRALGLEDHETLVRAYGAREVATGLAILTSHDPTPWIWGRVGGDALDLATLAAAATRGDGQQRENVALAAAAVAGVTALDVICARGLTAEKGGQRTASADYSDRRGFPRPALAMRGAARDFEVPRDMRVPDPLRPYEGRGTSSQEAEGGRAPQIRMRIKESQLGRILVVDDSSGHEFGFRVETVRGDQVLGAFAPRWANGEEPSSTTRYVIEARDLAEQEAVEQGWLRA